MANGNDNPARTRVLDTAQQLFHERGYKAVTMQDIAQALGMRQASLYYHAPRGKEQLFVDVASRTFERHREGLQQAIRSAGPDIRRQLLAVAGWLASQPPLNLFAMMHADMPALEYENVELLSLQAYRSLFGPLTEAFQAAQARGEIQDVSPDLLAGSFLGLMESIAYASANQPASPPRQVMAEIVIGMMLDGLRPRREDRSQALAQMPVSKAPAVPAYVLAAQ